MVVQHNLRAMNSNRMLGLTANVQSKSTEKLSSGYKINRAADDAAGLSISEKMRKQIRGLSQASLNAADGISSVQTAEGALNEVQDMLQRMNELAVKAANGTMSESDRSYIQNEVDQLVTEIDRVAETTKFNETYLLKGDKMAEKEWTADYAANTLEPTFEKIGDPYKKFYAAGGSTALTDEEIVEKLEAGEKIYLDPLEQKVAGHSCTNAATGENATVTIAGANGIKTTDELVILGETFAVGTDGDHAGLVSKLNASATFSEKYTAEVTNTNDILITAKDNEVSGAEIGGDISKITLNGADKLSTVKGTADDGVRYTFTDDNGQGWSGLYLEGGATALTEAEAKQALVDGKTLYYGGVDQVESEDHQYMGTIGSHVELDLTGWKAGDKITIDTKSISYSADLKDAESIADYINENNGVGETWVGYKAEVSQDGKLVIGKDDDGTVTSVAFGALITEVTVGGVSAKAGGTTAEAEALAKIQASVQNARTEESYSDNAKGWTGLYKAGGTTELTVDEAKQILKDGGKVYTTASKQDEAKLDVDYKFDEAPENAFFDADGNKIAANALDDYFDFASDGTATLKEGKTVYKEDGTEFVDGIDSMDDYVVTEQSKMASLTIGLHVGADATEDNQIDMKIEAMDAETIGVKGLKVDGKDDTNALNAIETIKAALQKVSTQRSALGAVQNRLEHTIANLDNVVENTTAAESQIRDTDMATEMVKFSNNNILAQAGQAMLAQANQANQGVLSLLG